MAWDDDEARVEFQWLSFMAAYKYDDYRDYHAGARFIESLAVWLQQFEQVDRRIAYEFIKHDLVYFSPAEIQRLVEKFFPEHVQCDLIDKVAKNLNIPKFKIWASEENTEEYRWERRKTLFMGLSDGARIDALRRMNVGIISNEQVVIATQIDHYKWSNLLNKLCDELSKIRNTEIKNEKFSRVYLIDDFTASGTSLLRESNGTLKGKLIKFLDSVKSATTYLNDNSPFIQGFDIVVHHYIGTEQAKENIEELYTRRKEYFHDMKVKSIQFKYGMLLSSNLRIDGTSSHPFTALCKKYYDNAIEGDGKHGVQSGTTDKMFGYANCGMPVVIEHNTPNNSLPLIWAETSENNDNHCMKPLFRRRERHSDMDQNQMNYSNGDLDE